jgi:hypothetical protein
MTPDTDTLTTAAKFCGYTLLANGYIERDGYRHALQWLLTPDGRDAMEKAILARDGGTEWQIHYAMCCEGMQASIRRVGGKWHDGHADTIEAALVAAIAGMGHKESDNGKD